MPHSRIVFSDRLLLPMMMMMIMMMMIIIIIICYYHYHYDDVVVLVLVAAALPRRWHVIVLSSGGQNLPLSWFDACDRRSCVLYQEERAPQILFDTHQQSHSEFRLPHVHHMCSLVIVPQYRIRSQQIPVLSCWQISPNDGKLEVFTLEGPGGVAWMNEGTKTCRQ